MLSRRNFTLVATGAALSACVPGRGAIRTPLAAEAPPPRIVPDGGWDAWVTGYRGRASARGISGATLDSAFRGAGFMPDVIEKDRNQVEFRRSLEDYLAIAASDERVALGRQEYAARGALLAAIESRYGVEGHVVAAFWGVESFYGTRRGNVPVISALSTLAYEGRRAAMFESQLDAALRILQAGDITPARMTGSWAGAMGHTQFMPTSFLEYAVDFTGDGRRDIWGEDPADALASTANYVARAGWRHGLPWGQEVILPAGFDRGLLGRGKDREAGEWSRLGIRAARGMLLSGSIIAPEAPAGPAFLLTRNFGVILRYNNSESYGLGVGYLSDRLRGTGALVTPFGPDATGLTRIEREEVQRLLAVRGFDTGGSDGVLGPKSQAAISAFQQSRGLAVTGNASPELLRMLRG